MYSVESVNRWTEKTFSGIILQDDFDKWFEINTSTEIYHAHTKRTKVRTSRLFSLQKIISNY